MLRRIVIFVICPVALSYGLALSAQAIGVRTAGTHWLASLFFYGIFALPALVLTIRINRRDFVQAGGALTGMAAGIFVWATVSYSTLSRYLIWEAALFALRDAALNVTLAGLVLVASLLGVRLVEAGIRSARAKVS